MNGRAFQRQVPQIININELAYLTGSTPAAVCRAGAALFKSLSGDDPDLSRALIAASSASGVEPRSMIAMMNVLALEFGRQPSDEDEEAVATYPDAEPTVQAADRSMPIIKRIAARAGVRRGMRKKQKERKNG